METADTHVAAPSIRPRRSKRLWAALLLTTWGLLSWNWWRECALLQPFARIPGTSNRIFTQFALTGEALFAQREQTSDARARPTYRGPVEFWSLITGQKTGEKFTSDDFIESLALDPQLLTVIRRHDQRWVADLATGQLLHQLPDAPAERRPWFKAGPGRILYTVNDQLVCFDYLNQRMVWTRDGLAYLWTCTDRYALAMPRLKSASGQWASDRDHPLIVDLATGQTVPSLERFHPCDFKGLSPDGRQALLQDSCLRVLDIERNVVVWQTDPKLGRPPLHLEFSEDGMELLQAALNSEGNLQIGRVRITDGQVLAPLPFPRGGQGIEEFPSIQFTHDRRFAFANRQSTIGGVWYRLKVQAALLAKKLGWSYEMPELIMQRALIDVHTGTVIGPISNSASVFEGAQVSPTGDGFVFRDYIPVPVRDASGKVRTTTQPGDWRIYHLPPARNWQLLVELWLAPLALWAAIAATRFLRRRRTRTS